MKDRTGQVWLDFEEREGGCVFVVVRASIEDEETGETLHPILDLSGGVENGWYEYDEGWENESGMTRIA